MHLMKIPVKKIHDYKPYLGNSNSFYYENDEFIYLGRGELMTSDKLDTLDDLKPIIYQPEDESIGFKGGFIGHLNYDLVKTYENIPDENPSTIGSKNIQGLYVKSYYLFDKEKKESYFLGVMNSRETETDLHKRYDDFIEKKVDFKYRKVIDDESFSFESNISESAFKEKVKRVKKFIEQGDVFQVVLSQRLTLPLKVSSVDLFDKLSHEKNTFKYHFNFDGYTILGLSPEILVKKKGSQLITHPIAGTRKRGKTVLEDKINAADLINDEKEIAEHMMLVDLARNDMGKVSKIGSVNVNGLKAVKYFHAVMHMTTEVTGETEKDTSDIIKSFLPAGTVSGAPKIRAMEIIDLLETKKREIYAGGIGYISHCKDIELAIAIRTLVIKNQVGYLQVGAGIVKDSKPIREYEETFEKANQFLKLIKEVKSDSTD